jgi:glucosamine-6-phosphate deaminase
MKLIKTSSYQELSEICAKIVKEQITRKPTTVLGLATGSTPVGMYENLARLCKDKEVSFKEVRTINLDEYVNLPVENENSYRYFMDSNLFNFINIKKSNTFVPNGMAENLEEECINYEKNIDELGGIDLQILGIGNNGHIGFNEPDERFIRYTHVVDLKESTILANSRFFSTIDEVPKQAITMGIKSIMNAKKILLIVNTPTKKDITEKALFGEITPNIPASILQLHPNLTVVMCEEPDPVLMK